MKKQKENAVEIHEHDEFVIVKNEQNLYLIVFGNSYVSQKQFNTLEDAKNYIDSKPYEIIFACCCTICRSILSNNNINQKNQKND